MSVRYTVSSTAQTGLHYMFDTTNYGGTTAVISENTITYNATTGRFAVPEKGVYAINLVAYFVQSGAGTLGAFRLENSDATTLWLASPTIHNTVDPAGTPAMFIVELAANEWVRWSADSNTTFTLTSTIGTTMNIWKID